MTEKAYSNKLEDLRADVKIKAEQLFKEWNLYYPKEPMGVAMTTRSEAYQIALILQGRKPLAEVNAARKKAGVRAITEKENADEVSWIKLEAVKEAPHIKKIAIDVFPYSADKKSTDYSNVNRLIKFGKFAKARGWTWGGNVKFGGDFKTQDDKPHIQWGR